MSLGDYMDTRRRELVAYVMAGVSAASINIVSYNFFLWCGVEYMFSNVIALVLTKLSAYALSKRYVFHTQHRTLAGTGREFMRFLAARGLTGLIDFLGLVLLVEACKLSPVFAKYFLVGLVVILNYVFSKWFVFK